MILSFLVIVADDEQSNNQNNQIKLIGQTSFLGQLNQNITAFSQNDHAFYPECLQNLEDKIKINKRESCDQFSQIFVGPKSKTIIARNFNNDVIIKNSRTGAGGDGEFKLKHIFVNLNLFDEN